MPQQYVNVPGLPAPVDGEAVSFDDPRLPPGLKDTVTKKFDADDVLVFTATREGGEWWLISPDGDLVEAYWLE